MLVAFESRELVRWPLQLSIYLQAEQLSAAGRVSADSAAVYLVSVFVPGCIMTRNESLACSFRWNLLSQMCIRLKAPLLR